MTVAGDRNPPTIRPLGDSAITIRVGDRVDHMLAVHVQALAERIRGARIPFVQEVACGYAALTVWYDGLRTDYETVVRALAPLLTGEPAVSSRDAAHSHADHVIPVIYDGPDLDDVARRTGLSASEVIARHSDRWYDVYLVGFVPGWAYLGALDPALVLPRRTEPRPRVPAGSVAIGGAQTGVYPLVTPGGWHLIGRTAVVLFDTRANPPALLAPGDRVRFTPIGA